MISKTVLVTGGAGFIGSHLCDAFLGIGDRVICVDNLLTGSLKNLSDHRRNPRFTFIRHDISKPLAVKGRIDAVLHFASPASPPDYLKYPIQTLKVGSLGTHNALGIAKKQERVFSPKGEINFDRDSKALQLIMHIRDEAHRFAQSYHHVLRRKKIIGK